MAEKYNYIIAHYWPKSGELSTYTWGNQVHYGNDEQSGRLLSYVKTRVPDEDWQIFKIQEQEYDR